MQYWNNNFIRLPSHVMDTLPPITPSRAVSSLQCIRSCPAAIEYNPVCGTDNVTYINPSSLECAKQCGIGKFYNFHLILTVMFLWKSRLYLLIFFHVTSFKDVKLHLISLFSIWFFYMFTSSSYGQ